MIHEIPMAPNSERRGKQISAVLYILFTKYVDDTVVYPKMNKSNRETGTVPVKDGEGWLKIPLLGKSVPTFTISSETGEIATNFTEKFSGKAGGFKKEMLNLMEEHAGEPCLGVFVVPSLNKKFIVGTPLKPCYLTFEEGGFTSDGTFIPFILEKDSGQLVSEYTGTIKQRPATVIAADTTSLVIADNDNYSLSAGSSATVTIDSVSGVTNDDIGRSITFESTASANPPKFANNAVFILKEGSEFVASAGKKITFEIFNTDILVEISRT